MKLNDEQLKRFKEEGWIFLPDCFSPDEVAVLREEGEKIYAEDRKEVWREASGAPRTAFAAHLYNEAFAILGRHPRLIEPVEQVFGEKVYMHQFKVNAKAKFTGDVWQWHQDYGTMMRQTGGRAAMTIRDGGDFVLIEQHLPAQPTVRHRLAGVSAEIYRVCDVTRSLDELSQRFTSHNQLQIRQFCQSLVDKHLMFAEADRYLSLALSLARRD